MSRPITTWWRRAHENHCLPRGNAIRAGRGQRDPLPPAGPCVSNCPKGRGGHLRPHDDASAAMVVSAGQPEMIELVANIPAQVGLLNLIDDVFARSLGMAVGEADRLRPKSSWFCNNAGWGWSAAYDQRNVTFR